MLEEPNAPVEFLTENASGNPDGPHVGIVRTRDQFIHWLRDPPDGVEWLQVEHLLDDQDVWAMAAQGTSALPLDVILADPGIAFSSLYRLVDVRIVRSVRVTMPAQPGFLKALRLAASIQLPVRLLPGQPSAATLAELTEAAEFYLHDLLVETPVEFFHSLLAVFSGVGEGTLWQFLEDAPVVVLRGDGEIRAVNVRELGELHLARLIREGAECATCAWRQVCAGYFKWPNPKYDCAGVKELFEVLNAAAKEIGRDLDNQETPSAS